MVAGAWGKFGVSSVSTRKGSLFRSNLIRGPRLFSPQKTNDGESKYDAREAPKSESSFRRLITPAPKSRCPKPLITRSSPRVNAAGYSDPHGRQGRRKNVNQLNS